MAYQSLNLDPATPPRVTRLIKRIENLNFSDVHTMLRLPIPNYRLDAGCNFAVTQVLMTVVGGISTTLYGHGKTDGERFKGLLEHHYPWHLEPKRYVGNAEAARIIYAVFRNPLTHDLGLDLKGKSKGIKVKVKKLQRNKKQGGMPEKWIENLEKDSIRLKMSSTVTVKSHKKVLLVEALYWGLRRMIESMTCDPKLMASAEAFLASKGY